MIPEETPLSRTIAASDRTLIVCLEAEEIARKRRAEYVETVRYLTKLRQKIQDKLYG